MIEAIKHKLESFFPSKRKKAIQNWDFILVFDEYFSQQIEMLLENIKCKQDFDWKMVYHAEEKQSLFLLRFSERVVVDMAHQLKILKPKNKLSFQFKLKDINTIIYTTDKDKSPHIYNYLCFIRARMFPSNKMIYEQEQYSAFNKQKMSQYYKGPDGKLFTDEQELRAKYHFLLSYQQKISSVGSSTHQVRDQFREPFSDIMKRPGFVELVPVSRVSKYKFLIFGSLKNYLGPNIDCYFDFVSFLQIWLVFPMIIGLLTAAVNYYFQYTAENSPVDFFYALLVMIWSILFITKWEEVEKWLQIKQSSGTSDYWSEHQNMTDRRGLDRKVSSTTGKIEHYLPLKKRIGLAIISNSICFAELLLTIIFMVYSLNARGFIDPDHKLFYSETISGWASPDGIFDKETGWGQIPNIVHVIVLNTFDEMVYRPIARKLAKFERHKSTKGYENSIILKYFVYEFFITFADLFYIAFVRFDIQGLREQLLSLFFIDIIRRVVAESLIPYLKKRHRSHSIKKSAYEKKQLSKEEELKFGAILEVNKEEYQPFDDYLEVITNLGYLVMISSCFPLAPTLILIAHGVQLVQDRYKIVHIFKRKLPQKYVGMGRWKSIVVALCYISIITNILLFAFSSQQVVSLFPKMFDSGKDLLYGNTDFQTLFGGAATTIFGSMVNISSSAINKTKSGLLLGGFLGGEQVVASSSLGQENLMDGLINNEEKIASYENSDDGWGTFFEDKAIEQPQQKVDDGWGDYFQKQKKAQKKDEIINPTVKSFKNPLKQNETTFIALLFFIEHFFLIGFIITRNLLAKNKSNADIFLERREYKRRIKKNLPKDILKLLTGNLLLVSFAEQNNLVDNMWNPSELKKTDSEEDKSANILTEIMRVADKSEEVVLLKQENEENEVVNNEETHEKAE